MFNRQILRLTLIYLKGVNFKSEFDSAFRNYELYPFREFSNSIISLLFIRKYVHKYKETST